MESNIPTLQLICATSILKSKILRSTDHCIPLFGALQNLFESEGSTNPAIKMLKNEFDTVIAAMFPTLLDRFGCDLLQSVLGDMTIQLQKDLNENSAAKSRMSSLKGTVIDAQIVNISPSPDGHFPLAALVAGVSWPPHVIASQREQYLSNVEFESVFGMSKATFNASPAHNRIRLKKEKNLF